MAEQTPVAPSPADGGSDKNVPTNTTEQAPVAPAPSVGTTEKADEQKPSEHTITLTEDEYKFWQSNGGANKLIPSLKKWIGQPESRPQPTQESEQAPQQAVTASAQQPTNQAPVPAGMLRPDEVLAQQYFNIIANDPKYANIASELRDGTVVKDLADFGVPVMVNGNINDAAIRRHIERYAAAKPAIQPAVADGGAPTVSYTEITDGKVENYGQAMKILEENGNPNRTAALKYLANMGKPLKK